MLQIKQLGSRIVDLGRIQEMVAPTLMSAYGYEQTFWRPLIFVRFTPQSRHT